MSVWKESYVIGVEFIDEQHKMLFDMATKLLTMVQSQDADERKQECIYAINFLKDYCIQHFTAEEEYQKQIQYRDFDDHIQLHHEFIASVHISEAKLKLNDFSIAMIKEFLGLLMAWLTYHVTGIDQKLRRNEQLNAAPTSPMQSYTDCFAQSAGSVLKTMAGIDVARTTRGAYHGGEQDLHIKLDLVGDNPGYVVFSFSSVLVVGLIEAMTSIKLDAIDEMVHSALAEISNIISGGASALISATGRYCDIGAPQMIDTVSDAEKTHGFSIDTALGRLMISVNI